MRVARIATFAASAAAAIVVLAAVSIVHHTGVGASSFFTRLFLIALPAGLLIAAALFPFALAADRFLASLPIFLAGGGPDGHSPGADLAASFKLPRWLRPVRDVCAQAVQKRDAVESALRSQARDLEIRCRVAETERGQLESILDSLRDAVVVTDSFNEIILANDCAESIFAFRNDDSINQPVDRVIQDREIVKLIRDTREGDSLATRRVVEYEMPTAGAGRRTYELSLSCLPGPKHEGVGGVITILHDVTREKEISEMKSDFVSKASHELRTPLSSIKAYVEMLIDGEARDDAARNEFYQVIQNESNRLSRLIDNMLNISRIEAGLVQAEWTDVDLTPLIEEVVELTLPQANLKNLSLNVKKSHVKHVVEADRDMMQQVVTNLVSNAIKYTPDGGRITIASELTDGDRSLMIWVSDTGLGIPPDAMGKLFDKFYRVENYKRIAKGTGLGLNLVKQIVETVHHGIVGVESTLGMGSKFWFIIPCRRPSA